MEEQFAVMHTEKGKDSGGGLGQHIDRTEAEGHSYKHADLSKINIDFTPEKYKSLTVPQAIDTRMKEGFKGQRAVRKDAVKFLATILTGSHERMKEIEKDPELFKSWINANKAFMEEEFGKDNIIRFTVHLDEKTPHIHCVHVPLTTQGALSAKILMNGGKTLTERQNRYAESMAVFGLKRGESKQDNKHVSTKDFYAQVNKIENHLEDENIKNKSREELLLLLRSALMRIELDKKKVSKYKSYAKMFDSKISTTNDEIKELYLKLSTANKSIKEANNEIKEYEAQYDQLYSTANNPKAWEALRMELADTKKTNTSVLSDDIEKTIVKGVKR